LGIPKRRIHRLILQRPDAPGIQKDSLLGLFDLSEPTKITKTTDDSFTKGAHSGGRFLRYGNRK
jgi:hypothetical protein